MAEQDIVIAKIQVSQKTVDVLQNDLSYSTAVWVGALNRKMAAFSVTKQMAVKQAKSLAAKQEQDLVERGPRRFRSVFTFVLSRHHQHGTQEEDYYIEVELSKDRSSDRSSRSRIVPVWNRGQVVMN